MAKRTVLLLVGLLVALTVLRWLGDPLLPVAPLPVATERPSAPVPGRDLEPGPNVPQPQRVVAEQIVSLDPADTVTLCGRVVARGEERPVVGAEVDLSIRSASTELRGPAPIVPGKAVDHVRTDALGCFRFDVERGRLYRLRVQAAGFAPEIVPSCFGGGAEVVVVVGPAARIDGVLFDDREPVPDLEVTLVQQNEEVARVRSAADGTFHFADLAAGEAHLVCDSRPFQYCVQQVALEAGGMHRTQLRLERGETLVGRVLDDLTSRPIAGAEVSEMGLRPPVSTDADGGFALTGVWPSATLSLSASADGHARATVWVGDRTDQPVILRLVRGATITGAVVDTDGRPLPNAAVVAAALVQRKLRRSSSYDNVTAVGAVAADGSFEIRDLDPQLHYWLVLSHQGFGVRRHALPGPIISSGLDVGALVMRSAAVVEGHVVDGAGAPRVGVGVVLSMLSTATTERQFATPVAAPWRGAASVSCATDASGRFQFGDLAGGSYRLHARLPNGRREVAIDLDLAEGDRRDGVVLLLPEPQRITGWIQFADGRSVDGQLDEIRVEALSNDLTRTLAAPDGDGSFRLTWLEGDSYTLTVRWAPVGWTMPPLHGVVPGTDGVRLILQAEVVGR